MIDDDLALLIHPKEADQRLARFDDDASLLASTPDRSPSRRVSKWNLRGLVERSKVQPAGPRREGPKVEQTRLTLT